MSEFDMENEQAFQIVHDNPRRRGVIRDVGYIVNHDVAERFAAYEASQKHRRWDWREIAITVILLFIFVVILVIQLAG